MSDGEPLGRRERKKREKRDRILSTAGALFRSNGYEATTTREISEAADVATGTLFSYFNDKRELLRALFLTEIDGVLDGALEGLNREQPLADQLMALFGPLYEFYGADIALGREIFRSFMFHGEVDAVTQRFIMKLVGLFEHAKARGTVCEDMPSATAAYSAFGLYLSGLLLLLGGQMPESSQRSLVRASMQLLVDGMRAA